MIELITGFSGSQHVSSTDWGSLHQSVFGTGEYVLNHGNNASAAVVSIQGQPTNHIRILDGDIMMQGRHVRITDYEEVQVAPGATNKKRNDLIVVRFTKREKARDEKVEFAVLEGTPGTSATDPPHYTGNLLDPDCLKHEMVLYRVFIDGTTINEPERVAPLHPVTISPDGQTVSITGKLDSASVDADIADALASANAHTDDAVGTESGLREQGDADTLSAANSYTDGEIADLATVATSGSYNDLADRPSAGAATPVIDNLLSDSSTSALSAKQGKVLDAKIANIASPPGTYFGTCSTAASTATKVVACDGFVLEAGARITIEFSVTNNSSVAKLNVNSTGAKPVVLSLYDGSYSTLVSVLSQTILSKAHTFIYDGTYWVLLDPFPIQGFFTTDGTTRVFSGYPSLLTGIPITVRRNGVKQYKNTDYTRSDGTLTTTDTLAANEKLEVVLFGEDL